MKRALLLSIGLAVLFILSAFAAVPQLINFQGILRDGSGNPVANGSYSVTFTIYAAATGGNNLWTETQSVATSSGLFAVLLGSSSPVPDTAFKGSERWLGIAVSPDGEMPARQRLVSVGYAYRVNSVDSASGGTITSKVSIGPGHTNTGTDAFVAGQNNQVTANYSTVGGGALNNATGESGVISGGQQNTASGFASSVSGGASNSASNTYSAIGGGLYNTSTGNFSVVDGGILNNATGDGSVVGGGSRNSARGLYSTVGGGGGPNPGDSNSALGDYSTISGGSTNTASDLQTTVGGGWGNVASSDGATVGGGAENTASGADATVGGGNTNTAGGNYATVGGGNLNTASGAWSTVGGGNYVSANANYATVSGGFRDTASGTSATVGGGALNKANNNIATVGGGQYNTASGPGATVGGGVQNTASAEAAVIGGGSFNTASGFRATVPGGFVNVASGNYSFAAGTQAKANHDGTFVWGDNTFADFASTANNQFLIRAAGGVGIGTNSPSGISPDRTTLHVAGALTPAYVLEQTGDEPRKWMLFTSAINGGLILRDETVVQTRLQIGTNGKVGIGTNPNFGDPSFKLDVRDSAAAVAAFDRRGDDGNVIEIKQAGTTEGIISVSGNTVTYGAFTGSHYGWTEETLERGELVTLTGINRNSHDNPKSEIIYGIRRSTEPNDPACLGSYFALSESSKPYSSENPHLVMAVGNGDMWVVDEGQNIQPGDYLISSSTPGHAMKDDEGKYPIGHIVARAAKGVDWSVVTQTVGGKKYTRISVLFGNFVRSNTATLNGALEQQKETIHQQQKELEDLKARLLKLEEKSIRAEVKR